MMGKRLFFLFPAFFVAVQFFYTLAFIGMLISAILIVLYLIFISQDSRVRVLRWTGIVLIVSGCLAAVAVLIFGILGDNKEFMPDSEHNYLSW